MWKQLLLILLALNLSLQNTNNQQTQKDKQIIEETSQNKYLIYITGSKEFDIFLALGLLLTFFSNILTNYIGVTGAGMLFSLLVFLFGFSTKEAIPIYKFCNLMAACINLIYIFSTRDSEDQNKLYLDWNLAAFCIPMLVTGSMIGVLISEYFPAVYLLSIILFILIIVLYLTIRMQQNQNNQTINKEQEPELTPLIQTNQQQQNRISILRIFYQNKWAILTVIFSFFCLILGNLFKGSPQKPSILFNRCSAISFVFYVLFLILPSLIGVQKSTVLLSKYERPKIISIGIYTVISGVITSFGISGSLIFTSSLVILRLKPLVLTSISRLTMFMSSLAAVIQFFIEGALDVKDALIIGIIAVLGSIVGLYLFYRFQRNKNPGLVKIVLQIILGVSIILMPFLIWFEVKHNPNAYNFGEIC